MGIMIKSERQVKTLCLKFAIGFLIATVAAWLLTEMVQQYKLMNITYGGGGPSALGGIFFISPLVVGLLWWFVGRKTTKSDWFGVAFAACWGFSQRMLLIEMFQFSAPSLMFTLALQFGAFWWHIKDRHQVVSLRMIGVFFVIGIVAAGVASLFFKPIHVEYGAKYAQLAMNIWYVVLSTVITFIVTRKVRSLQSDVA